MTKMIQIMKMLCMAIIITFMIANVCHTQAKSRISRSNGVLQSKDIIEDYVGLTEKMTDVGEPVFNLDCPLEQIIVPKENLTADITQDFLRAKIELIKQNITIDWLKDGTSWNSRANGNLMSPIGDFGFALYQLGESDAGYYSCRVDYRGVPRSMKQYFDFYRGASFTLSVENGPPNLKPSITHPPENTLARRGDNVTFTCRRDVTLSHQTTYWYKTGTLTNTTRNDHFKDAIDFATSNNDISPLAPFVIQGHIDDTLTIYNVSANSTGYYGCAVRNAKGVDARMAKLQLIEQWLDKQQEEAIADQLLAYEYKRSGWIWFFAGITVFLIVSSLMIGFIYSMKLSILRDKKQQQQQQQSDPLIANDVRVGNISHKESNLRQHLPSLGCPNIYNISKSTDGFISGRLHQSTGHILAQSICSNILDKENPSISSSNSQQSDEASLSWGKSLCSQGDNCRNFYLHTSNTTATTMPMYDHPPSNGTLRYCHPLVKNSCVINPTYGFLRPENDATDWTFPRRNLDRLDKIGEGQFGEVWRYIARQKDGNDDIVAVKQLKHRIGFGDRERLELIAEIEIMKSVNNHPNVIKLLHYCIDEYEPILLIMEYAEHGKLQTYLRNCRASTKQYGCISDTHHHANITSKELIKFTYHIAKGMEYVASQGIVHRDLASRNILVSRDKVCKVADFGFARRVNDDCAYERTTTNPVPVKWMAPEALIENKFTSKSDVFSLGILMWEIVTLGATPYEQLSSEGVYKKVTTGGRLDRPAHCSDEFYDLMAKCWLHDPALRPTFKVVALELEKLLLSDNDYIKLDQYPEHAYYNIINKEEKEIVNIVTQC